MKRKAQPGPGRPLELTEDVIRRAGRLLREGNFLSTTAEALGFTRETFRRWAKHGKADIAEGKPDTLPAQFYAVTTRARARAEALHVRTISRLAKTATEDRVRLEASKFFLTHSASRKRFSPRQELTGKHGGPVRTENRTTWDLTKLSAEQLADLRRMALAAAQPDGD